MRQSIDTVIELFEYGAVPISHSMQLSDGRRCISFALLRGKAALRCQRGGSVSAMAGAHGVPGWRVQAHAGADDAHDVDTKRDRPCYTHWRLHL
eukprot:7380500-Prymnesium_polylepis.1